MNLWMLGVGFVAGFTLVAVITKLIREWEDDECL